MDEPQRIYRGEALAMVGAVADIDADTSGTLQAFGEDDEPEPS